MVVDIDEYLIWFLFEQCCTPAMLFSASSADQVVEFLSSVQCRPGRAKDEVLYDHVLAESLIAYVVEPNLVQHIGDLSSLPRDS